MDLVLQVLFFIKHLNFYKMILIFMLLILEDKDCNINRWKRIKKSLYKKYCKTR